MISAADWCRCMKLSDGLGTVPMVVDYSYVQSHNAFHSSSCMYQKSLAIFVKTKSRRPCQAGILGQALRKG